MKSDKEFVEEWYDEITSDKDIVGAMAFCDRCKRLFKNGDTAWIKYRSDDNAIAHCKKCVDKKIERRAIERCAPYGGLFS